MNRADYPETDEELQFLLYRALNPPSPQHLDYLGVNTGKAWAEAKDLAREKLISFQAALTSVVMRYFEGEPE
jgi:hypothetical protein